MARELYIISSDGLYSPETLIDEHESLVWTERFTEAGDMRMIFPATKKNVSLVPPGTLVTVNDANELVILDTRSIEDGMITIAGKTLETFFGDRAIDAKTYVGQPRKILEAIVDDMQYRNWDLYIPNLSAEGSWVEGIAEVKEKVPLGSAYSALLTIAQKYNIGMAVRWKPDWNPNEYKLVFETRYGRDKTDEVLFSPDLDNLANINEVNSTSDSKNTVVVHPPKALTKPGKLAENMEPVSVNNVSVSNENNPFKIRVLELDSNDITEDMLEGSTDAAKRGDLFEMMLHRARVKLKELKANRVVDGESTPESQYKYENQPNPDNDPTYRLGDTVGMKGNFTNPTTGVVTEHIRSADATGAREYPTVVVQDQTTTPVMAEPEPVPKQIIPWTIQWNNNDADNAVPARSADYFDLYPKDINYGIEDPLINRTFIKMTLFYLTRVRQPTDLNGEEPPYDRSISDFNNLIGTAAKFKLGNINLLFDIAYVGTGSRTFWWWNPYDRFSALYANPDGYDTWAPPIPTTHIYPVMKYDLIHEVNDSDLNLQMGVTSRADAEIAVAENINCYYDPAAAPRPCKYWYNDLQRAVAIERWHYP